MFVAIKKSELKDTYSVLETAYYFIRGGIDFYDDDVYSECSVLLEALSHTLDMLENHKNKGEF